MRPLFVIFRQPSINIFLQFVKGPIDFSSESNPAEFIEYGLVEPLTDAACLRMPGSGGGMDNVLRVQIRLIVVASLVRSIRSRDRSE